MGALRVTAAHDAVTVALESGGGSSGRVWSLRSGGTDGSEGPTDAVGARVDSLTLERGGGSPRAALDDNDSYTFLEAAGGLLKTGATGTNVADLQVLLLAPRG